MDWTCHVYIRMSNGLDVSRIHCKACFYSFLVADTPFLEIGHTNVYVTRPIHWTYECIRDTSNPMDIRMYTSNSYEANDHAKHN
jgi:hypothetical protein